MSSEFLDALSPLLDRLQARARSDPKLRQEIAALGRALLAWVDQPAASEPRSVATPPPAGEEQLGWMPQEPAIIAARCRMKGEAAKLLAKKYGGQFDDAQFQAASAEVRAQAEKLPKCTLWMLDMLALSRSAVVWEDLAGGYTTAAAAAELVQAVTDKAAAADADQVLLALNLAAEAQSLLFSAVIDTGNPRPDADQIQLYVTVRECATARGIYIHRYLRREDRVDPRTWAGLLKRVTTALEPVAGAKKASAGSKKLLSNLRFKLKKATADGLDKYDEWPRVMELLDEALAAGVPANNTELLEMLLPVIEGIPDGVATPVAVMAVVRELDKALAAPGERPAVPYTEDVARSLPFLKSRAAVLVGGLVRAADKRLLEQAFELSELSWLTGADSHPAALEPVIARPTTGVVLFAVRWATAEYPDVQRLCTTHAKWLVRLPGGYHPNHVARQILAQPAPK